MVAGGDTAKASPAEKLNLMHRDTNKLCPDCGKPFETERLRIHGLSPMEKHMDRAHGKKTGLAAQLAIMKAICSAIEAAK